MVSKRRRARSLDRRLAQLPPLRVGGIVVPPELRLLLPADRAPYYFTTRKALVAFARRVLSNHPEIERFVAVLDLVGGFVDCRVAPADGTTVADLAREQLDRFEGLVLPLSFVYVERSDAEPGAHEHDAWEALLATHTTWRNVVDWIRVGESQWWSLAERHGPDIFSPEYVRKCGLDVQARVVREALLADP
jgi:hypothetical protein